MKIKLYTLLMLLFSFTAALAQDKSQQEKDEAYTRVITQRASKITATLGISDSAKYYRVTSVIAGQYRALNVIYTDRDTKAKAIKEQNADNKDAQKTQLAALDQEVNAKVEARHKTYLTELSKELNAGQIDKVKDGMTYNVRNVTFNGYTQMLPNLTEEQKKQIMDWLIEAREYSMDAESSEKKHAWFGKYKGRINNYLSKSGIDMKKAEADWQERIKAQQQPKSNG